MRGKMWLVASTALAGSLLAGGAFAQAPVAPTSGPARPVVTAPPPEANLIGEVIVTAEKREQSLQTVPVAVTAFTAEKRDLLGIESVVDQTNYTPGLTYTPSNDRISLRGVGRLTNVHAADSGTSIYTDGVFLTSATQAQRSPLFIERTEVLRGPQGTLYGRNAIGGTFNLISKRPTKDFSGEVRLTIGDYDTYRTDATVSIPITDNLRTRFNYSRNYQGEGFEHNLCCGFSSEAGNRDESYYEGQVEGEIQKLDFWFQYSKNVWHDSAPPGLTAGGNFLPNDTAVGNGTFPSLSYGYTGGVNLVQAPGATLLGNPVLLTGNLRDEQHDTKFQNTLHGNDNTVLHLTYHMPDFDIKYVGGWARYTYHYISDVDGTATQSFQVPLNPAAPNLPGEPVNCYIAGAVFHLCNPGTFSPGGGTGTYEEDEEYYSHDLTIASTGDSKLQYLAGIYLYHEKSGNPTQGIYPLQAQLATPLYPTGAAAPANPSREFAFSNDYVTIWSKAVYAQVDYKLTDTLKLTGGLRYTQDDKKATEESRIFAFGGGTATPATLANYGQYAPGLDITPFVLGASPSAAALAANGGRQQSVLGPAVIDPVSGNARRNLRDGSNSPTGTAGLEWQPDRSTLIYAKYSRGYKAFALQVDQASTFSAFPYSAPEQLDNYEVGLKKDWSRRLQTNIVGFFDQYYDAQVPLTIQQGANPSFSVFYNVPRSVLQGVELETTWAPIDRLTILFTYGYLDAHVTKACCVSDPNDPTATAPGAKPAGGSAQGALDSVTGLPTSGQDLKGQALPFSPKNKIAINGTYTYPLGGLGDLIGSASYLWRDEQYSSFFNRSYNLAPSRDQVDLRLTFRDAKKRFDIIGYARNIFDKDDFESVSGTRTATGQVYSSFSLVEPRTYGVEVEYRF